MGGYAWVTLATNDAYSLGALVLAHSLRRVGTKYELAVLVTPGVTDMMREKLASVFSLVQEVNVLDSKDEANLALLARPELGITFTKLHCWRLTQYDKCVFVDADTLVVRNCDELFEREELSAAPDVGWPDCFNSGVFVFKPSQQTFASITAFAAAKGSFDGGDQGLLNMYFNDWAQKDISKHLPFIYNMCSTATYSYLPAFKQFGEDVRIIHFIGITKPWLQYFDTLTSIVQPPAGSIHLQPLLQLWWNIFCEKVHPQLSPVMAGLAGALAQMTLGEPRSVEQIALEEHMRKQSWEQGQIDYMGRDSFDNIWKKICETLSLVPQRQPSPPKTDYNDELNLEETTNELIALPEEIKKVDTLKAKTITDQTSEQSLLCEISRDNILEQKDMEEDSIATPIQSIFPSDSSMKHSVITPFSASKETSKFHGDFKDSLDKCFSAKTSESEQFCKEDDTLLLAKLSGQTSTEIISEQPHLSKFDVQNLPQDNTILSSSSEIPEIYEHISSCTSNRDSNTFSVSSVSSDNIPKSCIDSIKQSTSDKNLLFSKSAEQEKKVDTSVSISNQNICTVIDTNLKTSNENVDYSVEEKLNKETKKCESIDSPNVENIFSTSVPIQVAESVLKTEPKEESKLMKEVVSEVVPPVQENVVPLSETLVELADQTRSYNLSSNVSPDEVNNIVGKSVSLHESNSSVKQNVEVLETLKTKPEIEITKENIQQLDTSKDLLEPIKIEQQSSEINSSIPKDDSILETTVTKQDATVTDPVYKEEEVTKLVDIQQQLQKEEMKILEENKEDSRKLQEKSAILLSKSEDQILQKLNETAVNPTISTPDTVRSSEISSIECPIRPNRTKETDLSTPTAITEPVPSVSPTVTVPESENQGKTVKKSTKKTVKKTPSEYDSTDGADGDSTEKKSVKKVVKKTVKKSKDTQDEGTESCTSTEKPKKTVKVAKKMSKPSQISGTDPPVPETPQVGSSNAPVPPKRKIKTSSTKSAISKRTDAEP